MANILIIEDDSDMRGLIAYRLQTGGHQVSVAETGTAGLELIHAGHPDLIVLDVRLPDTSGLELCRRLRADAAIKDTLVVMVSASAAPNEVNDGIKVGADDYVTKPFAPSNLVNRIEALLKGRFT